MKGGRRKRERDREGNLRINFVNRKVSQLTRRRLFFCFYKRGFFRKETGELCYYSNRRDRNFRILSLLRLRDPCRPARRRTASLFRLIKHASTAMINYNL